MLNFERGDIPPEPAISFHPPAKPPTITRFPALSYFAVPINAGDLSFLNGGSSRTCSIGIAGEEGEVVVEIGLHKPQKKLINFPGTD